MVGAELVGLILWVAQEAGSYSTQAEIEKGSCVNTGPEQQDCVMRLALLQDLHYSPGENKTWQGIQSSKSSLSCTDLGVSKMPLKGHPFEFVSSLPSAVAVKNIRIELRIVLSCFITGRLNSALEASQFPGDFPGEEKQCWPKAGTSLPVQWLSGWAGCRQGGDRGIAGSKGSIKYY